MKVSILQKNDDSISVAMSLRPHQATIEHGILLLNLKELEVEQLVDALNKETRR